MSTNVAVRNKQIFGRRRYLDSDSEHSTSLVDRSGHIAVSTTVVTYLPHVYVVSKISQYAI